MPTGLHGRYEQGADPTLIRLLAPDLCNACAVSLRLLRALVQAQPALLGVARGGCPAKIARGPPWRASRQQGGIWNTPENHLTWPLHRHVSDHLPCSKQSRFFRRVLSILPSSPLSATAHLQPLAQPTALRHPGSRCDIDSHPDCRSFLTLIVAPHMRYSDLRAIWSRLTVVQLLGSGYLSRAITDADSCSEQYSGSIRNRRHAWTNPFIPQPY